MKHRLISLLLCLCLAAPAIAANKHNNADWRSMPFVEMMVTMMKVMNQILGTNSFTGMNTLPYSPAFMPGMSNGMNGMNPYSSLAMFPGAVNTFPSQNTHKSFQNTPSSSNFWDPDAQPGDSTGILTDDSSMNGIWQTLSGDVIAIYNDNRFLWSDGGAKNLAGQLAIQGNKLIAYIPAKKITLYFQFYREPGQFIVRDRNSRVYTFKRIH